MKVTESNKYNQLKWLYSALSGVSAAFFLALFSGSASLENSMLLQVSTILFAACLPVFSAFAFAHVYMYEIDATVEVCEKVTNEPWVGRITVGSFLCLAFAFIFLIGHFSIYAMVCFILVALLSCYCIFQFLKKLTEGVAE